MLQGEVLVFCLTFVLLRGHMLATIETLVHILTLQAATTLGAMATEIFVQIGDHRKLALEETKIIINCLNCTEMIRSSLLISQKEKVSDIHSNERLIR